MAKVELKNVENIDIDLACDLRVEIHSQINAIKSNNFKLQQQINKNNNVIYEKALRDEELRKVGACLKDKDKVIKNSLTKQKIKTEKVHNANCITNGGKGCESVFDLITMKAEKLNADIISLLAEKLQQAGYSINTSEDILNNLSLAFIENKKTTAQKELVQKLINKGVL